MACVPFVVLLFLQMQQLWERLASIVTALVITSGDLTSGSLPPMQVLEVLEANNFMNARSAKMSQDDLLRLLSCFNRAGIHFA